jgi:hypothetical protein
MKLNLAHKLKVLWVVMFPLRRLWWWRKIRGESRRREEQNEQED